MHVVCFILWSEYFIDLWKKNFQIVRICRNISFHLKFFLCYLFSFILRINVSHWTWCNLFHCFSKDYPLSVFPEKSFKGISVDVYSGFLHFLFVECVMNMWLLVQLHGGMCKSLSAIYAKVLGIFPELEAARPRSTTGIQALCALHIALEKTKNILQHCAECSKLYLVRKFFVHWVFLWSSNECSYLGMGCCGTG